MNFIFTEEHIQFKDAIKAFLKDECTPASIRSGWAEKKSFNQISKTEYLKALKIQELYELQHMPAKK